MSAGKVVPAGAPDRQIAILRKTGLLLPGLFDDGFPGLFGVIGARISRTDRSLLPEGRDVAAVANGRWRIAAMA